MSGYQAGILLRLLGPLIEIVAVLGFVQYRGRGVRVGGIPLETLCWAGFGLGLVCVASGLYLTALRPRRPRRSSGRFDLDLGPDDPTMPPPRSPHDDPETEPEPDPWRELR